MPGYVNGIPHATSTDRIDLWPTTSRTLAQWIDGNMLRDDDPRLTNARPPTTHTHEITDVDGLQDALDGKTDTTDPRLSDARPPTTHTHPVSDVTGLQAALNNKTDTTDPRLSDARPPTAHTHKITDVDGLKAIIDQLTYDSGERDVSNLTSHVSYGTGISAATIRRVGTDVELVVTGYLTGDPSSGFVLMDVPLGFRPSGYHYRGGVVIGNTLGYIRTSSYLYALNVFGGGVSPGARILTTLRWFTLDPIPTTLPGDPA